MHSQSPPIIHRDVKVREGAGTRTVTVEPTMTSASKTAFVQGPEVEALLHLDSVNSKKLTSALLTVYI